MPNDEMFDVREAYLQYKEIDPELINNMRMLGLGEVLGVRVIQHFGIKNLRNVLYTENPYRLMEVEGIGFTRADNIAKQLGITFEDPRRQKALIQFTIENHKNFGHSYLPETILEKECKKQSIFKYKEMLDSLIEEGKIIVDENRLYLKKLYIAECDTAAFVKHRGSLKNSAAPYVSDYPDADKDQINALNDFSAHNAVIITGGPGCGKSYTIGRICDLLESCMYKVALCAPTGKAAKRVSDLANRPAQTIHRLLRAGWGTWKHNAMNPITNVDYIICDETSMVDIELAWRLLQSLPDNIRVVFVGDKDQLPPVGPGSFFRDTILSQTLPTYYLTYNHRQGKGSLIAHNASLINKGQLKLTFGDDLQFVEMDNAIEIRERIPELITGLINEGYDSIQDIQVLSPQHSTPIGVAALNEMLRFLINPKSRPTEKFSVGDKVMQTSNNYDLKIFNGYIGQILGQTTHDYAIRFFDADAESVIRYPKSNAYELMPAYCCTIHKYQGSEAKAGIVVLSSSHTYMWNRNLLYTAITRFKERCIIVGDAATFRKAITNASEQARYSKLFERLKGLL